MKWWPEIIVVCLVFVLGFTLSVLLQKVDEVRRLRTAGVSLESRLADFENRLMKLEKANIERH